MAYKFSFLLFSLLFLYVYLSTAAAQSSSLLLSYEQSPPNGIYLSWTKYSGGSIPVNYTIHRFPHGTLPDYSNIIASIDYSENRTNFTDTLPQNILNTGGIFDYAVIVHFTAADNITSNIVSVNISELNGDTIPPLPSIIAGEKQGYDYLIIKWTVCVEPDFAYYEVHMGSNATYEPSGVTLISIINERNNTTLEVVKLSSSTTYHFKVRTYDTSGNCATSLVFSYSTPKPPSSKGFCFFAVLPLFVAPVIGLGVFRW